MAAPKGNKFWEMRSSHGRKPIFATPEDLWNAAVEYFEWVESNPLKEQKIWCSNGEVTKEYVEKPRVMTLDGLTMFLDVDNDTWYNYKKKKDFLGVTTRIDKAIRDQKFAGATAELFNPNIIARDLGLADKKELTGEGGGPVDMTWNILPVAASAKPTDT